MVLGSTLADDPTRKPPEIDHSGHGVHSAKIFAPASLIASASAGSRSCFFGGRVPEDTDDALRASCCALAWASLADNSARRRAYQMSRFSTSGNTTDSTYGSECVDGNIAVGFGDDGTPLSGGDSRPLTLIQNGLLAVLELRLRPR